MALTKYTDRNSYKAGDKRQIVFIPDLVLLDVDEKVAITIEGKTYEKKNRGIAELNNYDAFDTMYIRKYYPQYKIVRTVVLYGGLSMGVPVSYTHLAVGRFMSFFEGVCRSVGRKSRIVFGIYRSRLYAGLYIAGGYRPFCDCRYYPLFR